MGGTSCRGEKLPLQCERICFRETTAEAEEHDRRCKSCRDNGNGRPGWPFFFGSAALPPSASLPKMGANNRRIKLDEDVSSGFYSFSDKQFLNVLQQLNLKITTTVYTSGAMKRRRHQWRLASINMKPKPRRSRQISLILLQTAPSCGTREPLQLRLV